MLFEGSVVMAGVGSPVLPVTGKFNAHWATGVHTIVLQMPVWQSRPTMHPMPSAHGEHVGPPQSVPVSIPFCTPSVHEGAHVPAVQIIPLQSPFTLQCLS
jgi:hypothetical protein